MSLEDRFFLEKLAEQRDWELWFTCSPTEGFNWALERFFEVIFCDRYQPGYPWREVMDHLASSSPRSCILLISPMSGGYLWQDVLQQGGYDILLRPLREKAVVQSIDAAARFISPDAAFVRLKAGSDHAPGSGDHTLSNGVQNQLRQTVKI